MVRNVHYFSDGCAQQYKNYENCVNLCYHKEDFGVMLTGLSLRPVTVNLHVMEYTLKPDIAADWLTAISLGYQVATRQARFVPSVNIVYLAILL